MRETTVARNYAETLLELARRAGDLPGYGAMIQEVADAVRNDPQLRYFLEAPRVSAAQKNEVFGKAFQDRMPRLFVRYLQMLVWNRRQLLIGQIAAEYQNLLDEAEGRIHAEVTVARPATDADRTLIAHRLSKALGKKVVPHLAVNPAIIGGLVVKIGDTVMDGSVRRRLALLRTRMAVAR